MAAQENSPVQQEKTRGYRYSNNEIEYRHPQISGANRYRTIGLWGGAGPSGDGEETNASLARVGNASVRSAAT